MHEEIEIEHNVPIKNEYSPRWGIPITFSKMEVGDSFFVPVKSDEDYRKRELTIRSQAVKFASNYGKQKKFKVKKYPDGFRIWRLK